VPSSRTVEFSSTPPYTFMAWCFINYAQEQFYPLPSLCICLQ
jgi:hypothetical protein